VIYVPKAHEREDYQDLDMTQTPLLLPHAIVMEYAVPLSQRLLPSPASAHAGSPSLA